MFPVLSGKVNCLSNKVLPDFQEAAVPESEEKGMNTPAIVELSK
jgi:hypothetical protein